MLFYFFVLETNSNKIKKLKMFNLRLNSISLASLFILFLALSSSEGQTIKNNGTKKGSRVSTTVKSRKIDSDSLSLQEKNVKYEDKTRVENLICIVTGEEADPKLKMEYEGKTYYFCCKKCMKKFMDKPQKYIKKF